MKKYLLHFLAIFILASCELESMLDQQPDQEIGENSSADIEEIDEFDIFARRGPEDMINVCKFDEESGGWVVITVNANALPALEAEGAVPLIDEDGDGFVTLPNECGIPVDCDDTDPDLTDNCDKIPSVYNPITGKTWMDRNLGASRVAESSTDAESYGDLYQWGRGTDGHQMRTSGSTTTLSSTDQPGHGDFIIRSDIADDWRIPQNDNLWQGVNGINNPCPTGYRLPTAVEWNEERVSWNSINAAGAFASPLKLPMAGFRNLTGTLGGVGFNGWYWSSTVSDSNARYLVLTSSRAFFADFGRAFGSSVRCIKD